MTQFWLVGKRLRRWWNDSFSNFMVWTVQLKTHFLLIYFHAWANSCRASYPFPCHLLHTITNRIIMINSGATRLWMCLCVTTADKARPWIFILHIVVISPSRALFNSSLGLTCMYKFLCLDLMYSEDHGHVTPKHRVCKAGCSGDRTETGRGLLWSLRTVVSSAASLATVTVSQDCKQRPSLPNQKPNKILSRLVLFIQRYRKIYLPGMLFEIFVC